MHRRRWGQIHEGGRAVDWGRTASDYATYRPDYPPRFYQRLAALGVGHEGQSLVDLACGTGFLAHQFARQGAEVTAIDIAPGQIRQARDLAEREGLDISWHIGPAEDLGALPSNSADLVVAGQCWWYFDHDALLPEVARVLRPEGHLVVVFFNWLVDASPLITATERLILEHNPAWAGAGWAGVVDLDLEGARDAGWRREMLLVFDEHIAFDHASWRGRIRASRGIGASLDADAIDAFDRAHAELLAAMVPERFELPHRLAAYWYTPSQQGATA